MLRRLLIGTAAAALTFVSLAPIDASAQSGASTVIMRRPLVSKTRTFDWTVGQWGDCSNSCGDGQQTRQVQCVLNGQHVYPDAHCTTQRPIDVQACTDHQACTYTWEEKTPWTDVQGCGSVVETREMQCRRSEGTVVARDACPKPVPDETRTVTDLRTCTYSWDEKPWSAFSSECAAAAVRTRKVDCLRSNGEIVAESFCSGAGTKPVVSETAERTSQCGYSWKEKEWSAYDSTCSTTAVRTRDVVCLRSDGVEVNDGLCAAVPDKPAKTETSPQYGSCSFGWITGEFGDPAPACGDTVSTRTVECRRSNGDIVPDAQCVSGNAGVRPSATEKRTDYATCTYGWVEGSWGAWSNTCGQGTQTRDVSCISSDGRKVSDASCSESKPITSQSDYRVEGCTKSWQDGEWSRIPGCGASKDVRTPTCLRSDGQTVSDAQCDPSRKPAVERPVTDYQMCTYGWAQGSWGAWSSSCGQASQDRDVWCESSDGRRVSDGSCSGAKPAISQSAYQTSGCGYEWVADPFSAPAPACGATTQTRVTWCKRSDGARVTDDFCQAAGRTQPSNTQPATDYSTCSFSWNAGGWSAPSSTCGAATQTRDVWCLRSDGTRMPANQESGCGGGRPEASQASYQVGSCSYARVSPSAWSGWDNACSGSAHRTRSYQCQRSDGQIVDGGECTGRGISLSETETGANFTNACPGYIVTGGWSDYSSHCSASATRTRDVTCLRAGDNAFAGDQYCIDRGVGIPPRSETGQVYDQCGYTWSYGGWGAPAAACGSSGRYRAVWCTRSDGATVADASCNPGTRPPEGETVTDYSACGYGWAEGAWRTTSSTCGSTSQTHDVWCRRSDGATVADGSCGGGRPANDRSYTDYSACGYGWVPGAFVTPSSCGGTTASRPVPCIRQDGAHVADAYCAGTPQPSTTQGTSDYSACGYNWRAGAFGAPAAACGASSQSRDVWCERSDGARVADGACGGGRPGNTQPATSYATCGYHAHQIVGYSDWNSHCSGGATRTQYYNCIRTDGTVVDNAECTNRGIGLTNTSAAQGVYDQCGYSAHQIVGYSDWNSHCSGSATRTQYYNCIRSDGTVVDNGECTNRGIGLTNTSPAQGVFDQCGYTPSYGPWGTCSNGSRSRPVYCTRSDGAGVDAGACGLPSSQSEACSSGRANGYCLFVTNEYSDIENAQYIQTQMNSDWARARTLGPDNYPVAPNAACASGWSGWRGDPVNMVLYGASCSPVVHQCIERNPNQSGRYPR